MPSSSHQFAAQIIVALWCMRFVQLSVVSNDTDGGMVRGGEVPISCVMITSNGDNRMSMVSALWSLNSCTNLNRLTSSQRRQYRLRTCIDAIIAIVLQLPVSNNYLCLLERDTLANSHPSTTNDTMHDIHS